jgi:hypothetical protein
MKGQPRSMHSHPIRINRFLTVTAVVLALPIAARATTVTLDLSSLPTGTFTSGLSVDGFTLTPNLGPSSIPMIVDVGGLYALESSGDVELGSDTLLTMNGGTFTLDSIEVAAVNGYTGNFGILLGSRGGDPPGCLRRSVLLGVSHGLWRSTGQHFHDRELLWAE